MNDTLSETLAVLALRYHKSDEGEGEYGCPGLTCPGVQRLMGFARDVALASVRADHLAHSFKDSRELQTPEDATKAIRELRAMSGELCTCLSISRDPLCVHHGDVPPVVAATAEELAYLRGRVAFYERHADKQANELVTVTLERDEAKAALQAEKSCSQEHLNYFLMERSETGRLSVALKTIADMDLQFAKAKDMHDRAVAALARPEVKP